MEDIVTSRSMLAVGVVMPVVAGVAVGLRVWNRWSKDACLREHDYLIFAAYLILLTTGIMLVWGGASDTLASQIPTGDEPSSFMYVVTPKLVATEKMKFAYNLLVNPAIGFVKLSVLTWYRTVFRGRTFNAITITMIVFISLWIVATWFAFFFQCGTNFGAVWSSSHDLLTKCNNYARYYNQVLAIPDFVTDVLIVSIPIPMVWNLKLDTAKKIGLYFVFLLGALACAAALTRLLVYQKLLIGGCFAIPFATLIDQTIDRFTNSQSIEVISIWMFWSQIELGISTTAACLPVMAPSLCTEVFQKSCNSLQLISSNVSSWSRLRHPVPYKTEPKMSHGPDRFDSDDMLFRGPCARVRTSVTANTRDVEHGVNGTVVVHKPGMIVATTNISQYHVDRDDLSPT